MFNVDILDRDMLSQSLSRIDVLSFLELESLDGIEELSPITGSDSKSRKIERKVLKSIHIEKAISFVDDS